jgi:hypothetical protein
MPERKYGIEPRPHPRLPAPGEATPKYVRPAAPKRPKRAAPEQPPRRTYERRGEDHDADAPW